jgi:hypothetical protein
MVHYTTGPKIRNAISTAFDKIGKQNGHACPKSTNNQEGIVYELFVAQQLSRLADARKKAAMASAVDSGVIFDHTEQPRSPGDYTLFSGEFASISLRVNNPSVSVDPKRFRSELAKLGVALELINEAEKKATIAKSPAHVFTVALTDDPIETQ